MCDDCERKLTEFKSLKEVVVFRRQQVVHIYNVIEHGRRYYRSLVYTSDSRWALADLIPVHPPNASWAVYDRWAAAQTHPLTKAPKAHEPRRRNSADALAEKLQASLGMKPGDPLHAAAALPHYSLVITRNWSSQANRIQKYIPRAFLQGLIPHTLLVDYIFWQESDDALTGFLRPHARGRLQTPTILRVQLLKDATGEDAGARIMRCPVGGKFSHDETASAGGAPAMSDDPDGAATSPPPAAGSTTTPTKQPQENRLQRAAEQSKMADEALNLDVNAGSTPSSAAASPSLAQAHHRRSSTSMQHRKGSTMIHATDADASSGRLYLLNLLYAADNSPLAHLADFLIRIEDLSHVLVWSRTPQPNSVTAANGMNVSIDVIELPRLQLSFVARREPGTSHTRLYSQDHNGMFVSNMRDKAVLKLLDGLPHSILLENNDGDLAILLPTCRVRRLRNRNEPYSSELLFVRRDHKWWSAQRVRSFLFPVHLSLTFMFTPSLSSALYLLLLRFLNRQYADVFQLADSCVSDSALTVEESQILGEMHLVCDDTTPDAHACRLKLSLVTADSSMPALPWDALHELRAYLKKRVLVSAACRLSGYEEYSLLMGLQSRLHQYPWLFNRMNYLGAILNGQGIAPVMLPSSLMNPLSETAGMYDHIVDKSALTGDQGFLSSLSNVSYKKPKEEELKGLKAAQSVHRWLEGGGFRLKGGKDDLGFLFLYELMTGTVKVKIMDHDNGYELARLLLRLLPPETDYASSPNMLLSILRVLALNPTLVLDPSIPKVDAKARNFGMTTLFKGSDNMFSRLLAAFPVFMQRKEKEAKENGSQIVWGCYDLKRMEDPPSAIAVPVPPAALAASNAAAAKATMILEEKEEKNGAAVDASPLGAAGAAASAAASMATGSDSKPTAASSEAAASGPRYPRDLIVPRLKDISCSRYELPLEVLPELIKPADRIDTLTPPDLKAFSSGPLRVLALNDYVALRSRTERGLVDIEAAMPFDLSAHPIARTYNGASVLGRVAEDVANYARQQNEGQEAELLNYLEPDVNGYVAEGPASEAFAATRTQLAALATLLGNLHTSDLNKMTGLIVEILRAVNTVSLAQNNPEPKQGGGAGMVANIEAAIDAAMGSAPSASPSSSAAADDGVVRARLSYSLARYGALEGTLTFDFLVGLLLSPHPQFELQQLNPLLSASVAQAVLRAIVQVLFLGNRLGHVRRCRAQLIQLQTANEALLTQMTEMRRAKSTPASPSSSTTAAAADPSSDPSLLTPYVRDVVLTAEKLAGLLVARRFFMELKKGTPPAATAAPAGPDAPVLQSRPYLVFDPRFLVFEFTYNLLLRKSQVELVSGIVHSGTGSNRPSVCHQMIMGAGKVRRRQLRASSQCWSVFSCTSLTCALFVPCFVTPLSDDRRCSSSRSDARRRQASGGPSRAASPS